MKIFVLTVLLVLVGLGSYTGAAGSATVVEPVENNSILSTSNLTAMDEKQLSELTKEELIAIILGDRTETVCTLSEGDTRGMARQIFEARDYKGNLLSVSDTKWTYYPAGNVDTITVKNLNSKELTTLAVKHDKNTVTSTLSSKVVADMSKETVNLGESKAVEGKEIVGIK